MIKIEWIEVPSGEFTVGLTTEQKADFRQRLYEVYGIGELDSALRRWVENTLNKSLSEFTPEEDQIWNQLALEDDSSALRYHFACLDLRNIQDAKVISLPTFYIARFPITYAQADIFYQSSLAKAVGWDKRRGVVDYKPPDRPEQFTYWEEADALAHWLGGRLPIVVEWEKAARGADGRLYPWGNEWDPAAGNFGTPECRQGGDPEKREDRVTAVDAYPEGASPYGVMDMVGNLGEWTATIPAWRNAHAPMYMGYHPKDMPGKAQWFWALPVHRSPGTFNWFWYVGCRPILTGWGRQLWPGYRAGL